MLPLFRVDSKLELWLLDEVAAAAAAAAVDVD
jgi:hypothetical protein